MGKSNKQTKKEKSNNASLMITAIVLLLVVVAVAIVGHYSEGFRNWDRFTNQTNVSVTPPTSSDEPAIPDLETPDPEPTEPTEPAQGGISLKRLVLKYESADVEYGRWYTSELYELLRMPLDDATLISDSGDRQEYELEWLLADYMRIYLNIREDSGERSISMYSEDAHGAITYIAWVTTMENDYASHFKVNEIVFANDDGIDTTIRAAYDMDLLLRMFEIIK